MAILLRYSSPESRSITKIVAGRAFLYEIRRAVGPDVLGIVDVKRQVWPDEDADVDLIAAAVADPGHATHLAMIGSAAAGFVDGFLTRSASGLRRWEVDLLAVAAPQRGRGIGRGLVEASTQAGCECGARLARALIKLDNSASERAFHHNGYRAEGEVQELHVLPGAAVAGKEALAQGLHLVNVLTFNYTGVWLEPAPDVACVDFASIVSPAPGADVVGVLIPFQKGEWAESARSVGFEPLGRYRWWVRML
jgi:GNAT superfamily N-acetyltransferase